MTTNITTTTDTTTVVVEENIVRIELNNVGVQGTPGLSGVVAVTSPITNSGSAGSAIVGINQALLSITKSQVSDFTSGTVTSASTAQQSGTAVYSVNSGTAVYATTSGTAVSISGSITKSQVSDFTSGTVASAGTAQQSGTAVYATTSGTADFATNASTAVNVSGSAITRSQISDFTSGTVASAGTAQQAGTAVYATTSGTAVFATTSGTAVFATNSGTAVYATTSGTAVFADNASTAVSVSGSAITQSQIVNLVSDLAGKASLGSANAFTVGGHVITNAATAVIPLVVKGASGQSVDLLQIQSNAAVLSAFGNTGNLRVRTTTEFSAALNVAAASSTQIGAVVRGAASQSANLQSWQNSGGTTIASVDSAGNVRGLSVRSASDYASLLEANSGGYVRLTRQTAATPNPGANLGSLYLRDGTNAGTLKLVTRAGTAGVEETLFDNLDTSGTASIAIGSGVRATDATVTTAANGVGYMGLPQNSTTTGSYTIVAADAGEHIYASATRTVTIPANSALALPIGTTLTFIAGAGATMTIAITTDTMYLAGAGTTGSRTLAAHGIATAVKTTSTTWIISGNGLT